jgi:hypothetical protein
VNSSILPDFSTQELIKSKKKEAEELQDLLQEKTVLEPVL